MDFMIILAITIAHEELLRVAPCQRNFEFLIIGGYLKLQTCNERLFNVFIFIIYY